MGEMHRDGAVAVLAQAERALSRLQVENARLRAQAVELRARVRPPRHERIIRQAQTDAGILLHYRHGAIPISRRWLDEAGIMSEWRYGWACGLLRYARVYDAPLPTLESLQRALGKVESKAQLLLAEADPTLFTLRAHSGLRFMRGRYDR